MPKKVFISWSGPLGRHIAEKLKEQILDHSEIEPWVSSQNINAGEPFFSEIDRAAKECDAAIGCITPGAARRPWVNFEFGLIFGRLKNFKILLFEEELEGPLRHIQALNGTKKEDLLGLLKALTSNPERAQRHMDRVFVKWQKFVRETLESRRGQIKLGATAMTVCDSVLKMTETEGVAPNRCFQEILNTSLGRVGAMLQNVTDTYAAPQSEYPYNLIDVQSKFQARVDAIALLQQEEQFWQRNLGREIRDSTHRESRRVFVVRSPAQLEEHWETLLGHAKSYKVFVLGHDVLLKYFEEKLVRDFSIINFAGSGVVALYDGAAIPPMILYSANAKVAKEYEAGFEDVIKRSIRLDPSQEPDLETLRIEVFSECALSPLDKRPIEMSAYISIENYDTHEEKHSYYVDMMGRMLEEFHNKYAADGGACRVLELGAGTGIFTKRLAKSSSVKELVALEIDWACFKKLHHRFEAVSHIKVYNEDSRRFNPSGRFHAVFSSFADHHIKLKDKADYLGNVRRNLVPGGLFIVGDEYLPAHDMLDKAQRGAALRAYHSHIIERAERDGEFVLAGLERDAMESGLHEVGDFKLSCDEYERRLVEAGFEFRKERIGPLQKEISDQVGGVYVYVAWDGKVT